MSHGEPQPAPPYPGEPVAAAADATEASGSALAACDPAATSTTEQAEVKVGPKAGPNAVQPTPIAAPGIVKSHP